MKDISVLKWIYKHCGNRKVEGMALVLLNAWSAVSVTLFAVLSKSVIDSAQAGDSERLTKNILLFMIIMVLQIVVRIASAFTTSVSQGKAEICLKDFAFSSVVYGKYAEVTGKHSGDLMTRLSSDVQFVCSQYISFVPNMVTYVIRILSAAIALYALEKRFATMIVVCGIVVSIIVAISRKKFKAFHRRVLEKESLVRAYMQEMIENLFAIKVFGIEKKVTGIALEKQKSYYREEIKKKSFSIIAGIGFSFVFSIGFLLAVICGAYGILNDDGMKFGDVVAIIQLVGQLRAPIIGITRVIPAFLGMIASAQRLIDVCETEKEDVGYANLKYEDFKKIRLENVSFGYGEEKVITNADFTINKGEFVGIKGPSGAGKSTVFKLITGLYPVETGKAVVEMADGELDCRDAKRLFSFVPQDNMLFSGTIRENITMLNPDATDEEIRIAIEKSVAEFIYTLDGGLEFMLGESGAGVSQGQAQRIAIARALLGKGKILLMDESTSALDSKTEDKIINNLKNDQNTTVLFITHREMVMEQCDRTITVMNGRVYGD